MFAWLAFAFTQLPQVAKIMRSDDPAPDKLQEVAAFFASIDDLLYDLIIMPDVAGSKGSRHYTEQASHLAALCTATLLIGNATIEQKQMYNEKLRKRLGEHLWWDFGHVHCVMTDAMIDGNEDLTDENAVMWLNKFIASCWRYDCKDRKQAKTTLLDMFLYDEACAGYVSPGFLDGLANRDAVLFKMLGICGWGRVVSVLLLTHHRLPASVLSDTSLRTQVSRQS